MAAEIVRSIPVWWHPDQLLSNPQHEWDKRGFRPHPETSLRLIAILEELQRHEAIYQEHTPELLPELAINSVHSPQLLKLYGLAEELEHGQWYYPTSFPKKIPVGVELPNRLEDTGYFCEDTSTWLSSETRSAAIASASSAYAGAQWLLASDANRLGYALSRPPGHHAGRQQFGGYCYFNNVGIAANALTESSIGEKSGKRVTILDIDYHHGDGTQDLFYQRGDVQTVSIHADPAHRYPYFAGFSHEVGEGAGAGANCNVVLPPESTGETYLQALSEQALPAVKAYQPDYLVVAFGTDTLAHDTVGDFGVELEHIYQTGLAIGQLDLPTLVIQEGGYNPEIIGKAVHQLLQGISASAGQR
jgi:acetoin utilization deacetylase AcuC-like enzyme